MNMDDFAGRMREHELYQGQRFLPGAWVILRVDGRGFSGLTEAHYTKPFDERFRDHMHAAALALVEDMQGALAYVQSDEISVVLPPDWALFDRRQEKAVSLSASIAAVSFSMAAGRAVQFDGRAWVGASGAGAALLRAGVRHWVIHPGSHGSAGNWELARYRALAGEMRLRGWDVLVTGTARERAGMDDLWSSEGAPLAGHLVDATGRFSVAELMTLLARVDAVVAASTGPLHLAAALGTPVVGLYGGGAPVWPARWHPIGAQARWLVADTVRPDGTLDIPVGEVVEALEAFDSRATEGSMGASATATLRDDR